MRYKRPNPHYVWCDWHGEVHLAETDYYRDSASGLDGQLLCAQPNWRKVYVESDDKDEEF